MIPIWKKLGLVGGAVGVPTVTITTTKNGTFELELDGVGTVFVNPGNGDPVEEFDLSINPTFDMAYDGSGYTISITGDLGGITELEGANESITAINNFHLMTNLVTLLLASNSIIDISSLAGLTSLTTLQLYSNDIADISSLAGLTSLTTLSLSNNDIADISSLAGLTSLAYLNLYNNDIADISSLAGLTSLAYLNLYSNDIADISSLAGLTSLTTLYLSSNPVTYTATSWPPWGGTVYDFASCLSTAGEVDQLLIDLAAGGMNSCILYVDGTNPARTSASDAAILTLIGNGVTVNVNE